MRIIFLGTGGSIPTRERGSPAIAIMRKREVILFDCGEGTQHRMAAAHVSFNRPTRIFVTHLHGDHVLGLPGLLQTMSLLEREIPLQIYGPRGLASFIAAFTSILGAPTFPLEINELVEEGVAYSGPEYRVEAVRADHDGESWSYGLFENPRPGRFHPDRARMLGIPMGPLWRRLQYGERVILDDGRVIEPDEVVDPPREGRRIIYSGDTRPNRGLIGLAEGADILIHEATFDDGLAERAYRDGHSTARQAAEVALAAGARALILIHISSRYPDASILLEQARAVFPNTMIAADMMEVDLPP
jgi:ribonuclease Z